ncbi:MAG: phosphoribosylamine--glycine ligase [Patescibacteria group bacterium]
MNILVIGSGAREHALVWKLAQDTRVKSIICSPGNDGIAEKFKCVKPVNDHPASYLEVAQKNECDFTIIGPELPLVQGIADQFIAAKLAIFGPRKTATLVTEGSKIECKKLLTRAGVPTAAYSTTSNLFDARDQILNLPNDSMVIKADGLAAGKGVIVCNNHQEAIKAIEKILVMREFGTAGDRVLIEERLYGQECSFIVITDGNTAIPMIQAQDYKRLNDDDQGPMTGGMGAYAPSPLDQDMIDKIMGQIVKPTLEQLQNDKILYQGAMYFGLMMTHDGPKVLELNCRFGDPETQVTLPLLKGNLLLDLLLAAAKGDGSLKNLSPEWHNESVIGLTLASPGYPGKAETGKIITGVEQALRAGAILFYAGVKRAPDGTILTNGGRVMTIVYQSKDLSSAYDRVYAAANRINFDGGMQMRHDIAM